VCPEPRRARLEEAEALYCGSQPQERAAVFQRKGSWLALDPRRARRTRLEEAEALYCGSPEPQERRTIQV
jgi:hypothetical protein